MICDEVQFKAACEQPRKRKQIIKSLRFFKHKGRQDIVDKILAKIPIAEQEVFLKALDKPIRPSRKKDIVIEKSANKKRSQAWQTLLATRCAIRTPADEMEDKTYRKHKRDDQQRLHRKFPAYVQARDKEDETWRSDFARRFEQWCLEDSWVMCEKCHRMVKRNLHESDITGKGMKSHTTKHCKHCKDGIGYPTTQKENIPWVLQDMHADVLWALRPLEGYTGPATWAKHGYRVKTDMIRFWWRPITVKEQIKQIDTQELKEKASAAYKYLMADEESSYKKYVQMHQKFLSKNKERLSGHEEDVLLRLPRRALEEVGLECAVWPHLYPKTKMCESYIRSADERRKKPKNNDEGSGEEEEESTLNFAKEGRNSPKAAFMAKLMGPVTDYAADFELFQYVYDLWLWTNLGAKKNAVQQPMRLACAGYGFSPEYWTTRHAALLDMVRQLGLPQLFITFAPYEWSFPYHAWIEDSLEKHLRSRLHLAPLESLHIAHVLAQTVVNALTGSTQDVQGKHKPWTSHIFAAKDGSGHKTVINFFARLEYQDGKRKKYVNLEEVASQYYHGRGTPHIHMLIWMQHMESAKLEESVSASSPLDNEALKSLVEGSQRSYTGSGWTVQDEPSHFDLEDQVLKLHHSTEDHGKKNKKGDLEGIRAYIIDLISALRCHVDVQTSNGRGMLLRYVSGYVPKFSDAFSQEWLSDKVSDYAVARRVLIDYHPLEPEMILQLAMQWFPQVFAGGSMTRFVVPVPWKREMPARVQQYMACTWRKDSMTLAEFLRKSNSQGNIHQSFQKRHKDHLKANGGEFPGLEDWINNAPYLGDVLTASIYLSRYNDEFHGQWIIMNIPFRSLDELWVDEIDLVPDYMKYLALALSLKPEHWNNDAAIRADLELHAFKEFHIRNIINKIRANHLMIQKYTAGEIDKNDDERPGNYGSGAWQAGENSGPPLDPGSQQRFHDEISHMVWKGMELKNNKENEWRGEEEENEDGSLVTDRYAMAVLGPAGSGKSTTVQAAVRTAIAFGARVLLVAPTGRLAASLREKFPDHDVDTIHGAFQVWKNFEETIELMWPYDLVVVEEVGQLSRALFERLIKLWLATERMTSLVFVGDFWQLPGVEPTKALDSPQWRQPSIMQKRELHVMRRCKCEKLKATLEILRTGKPSVPQLHTIKRGHKAPSRAGYIPNEIPTEGDIAAVLVETPKTLFLTISRWACGLLNDLAQKSLFSDSTPLAVIPADPESNPYNFHGSRMTRHAPSQLAIFKGMRVILTKNENKKIGFVNGMGATVLGMENGNVIVWPDQGSRIIVHPIHDDNLIASFPIRLGYASTLHKVQGATLKHITVWLDTPNVPAAGYVALSRVEKDEDWRFLGQPFIHHFTPARF